jgi:hypothetical protein
MELRVSKRTKAGIDAGMELAPIEGALRVVEDAPLAALAELAKAGDLVVVLDASEESRAEVLKAGLYGFELDAHPELVFASTVALVPSSGARRVELERRVAKIVRKDAEEPATEERYVFGVVLEPDVVDSQGDTYSADEVRKAAHRWMENYGQLGKQHVEIVTGKIKILESFVAPIDFSVGEQVIKAGTWLLATRIVDDELWTAVKAGSFTGYSIGGTAVRKPEPAPA